MNNITKNQQFDWSSFLSKLSLHMDSLALDTWIKPLSFVAVTSGIVTLNAPSRFIKNYVLAYYKNQLMSTLKEIDSLFKDLEINVSSFSNSSSTEEQELDIKIEQIFSGDNKFSSTNLRIPLSPENTFENFVVGKPNEFAYNAALGVARSNTLQYNPLFIHGGVGLGKTHLMQSIAWEISKNTSRKVLYVTAEKFATLFIMALKDKDIFSFKEIFRSTDVLLIDDFQFIAGKEATQEEFFHTFNALLSQGKQIVFTADRPPSDLDRIEERLKSRLHAGLSIDIHATTYELRVGILESKSKNIGIKIPSDVIDFLATTLTSNVRELEGALKRIISYHQLMKIKVDLDMANNILADVLRHKNKVIDIDTIQKKVAEYYSIKYSDMISAKKDKPTSFARQVAMYITKQMTRASFPEIGRKFGGRDHTTVIYATNKIASLLQSDTNIDTDIKLLIKVIQKS